MSQSKRNRFYDAIRGVAILLVVLGHTIQYGYHDFDEHIIFRIIYSFHMPLFMFISGRVVTLGKEVDFEWLKRKFVQLVIPFGIWIFVPFLFEKERNYQEFLMKLGNIIQSPDRGGLWFLWVLFLNCCALYVGILVCKKTKIEKQWLVLFLEWAVIFVLSKTVLKWFGVPGAAYYLVYYFTGYLLGIYEKRLNLSVKFVRICQVFGTIGYLVLVPMWHRTRMPFWLTALENSLPGVVLELANLGFKYLTAFCGILMIWLFVSFICKNGCLGLDKLGRYTLEIYALHYYFITLIPVMDHGVAVIINFVLSLILSVGVAYIIENGYAAVLLFGKKKTGEPNRSGIYETKS